MPDAPEPMVCSTTAAPGVVTVHVQRADIVFFHDPEGTQIGTDVVIDASGITTQVVSARTTQRVFAVS